MTAVTLAGAAPENRGINETRDLIAFTAALGRCVAGRPEIVAAFRARNFAALGPLFLGMAADADLRATGARAFDGIREIPAEVMDLDLLEGAELAGDALNAVKAVYGAYASAHANHN